MKNITNKLRVVHFANIPCKPFIVDVKDEQEAHKVYTVMAEQHLFLQKENIIPDYSNVILVEMLDENNEWCDYYNEEEGMDWDEVEANYFI